MWQNRKGVSIMIGYVLLISLAVVMGGVLYVWMKSYVPNEQLQCPEGASVLVKDYNYSCSGSLEITVTNNGRFDLGGYHIKATTSPEQTIATQDLSSNLTTTGDAFKYPQHQAVLIGQGSDNTFTPGSEATQSFEIGAAIQIYTIEIIPTRWQRDENNRLWFVTCGNMGSKQEVTCS